MFFARGLAGNPLSFFKWYKLEGFSPAENQQQYFVYTQL
jgi:hypothetical protein